MTDLPGAARGDLTESPRRPVVPIVLAALAFGGSLLPSNARPVSYLQQLLGLDAVPDIAQAIVLGLLAAGAVFLAPRRLWPLFAVTAIAWLLRSTWPVLIVSSYLAANTYRWSFRLGGYAVAATALALLPELTAALSAPATGAVPDLPSQAGGAGLFVWAPLAVGLWLNDRRQVLHGLRDRAAQLEREQAAKEIQARAEERARIARDMHDVVAHRVSLMVLHAGALEMNAKDSYTATEAELIRVTGKDALAQLRQVLGVLKSSTVDVPVRLEPQPTVKDLDRLLDQSRSAGVTVVRRDEGPVRELPVMVANTVYRIAQEALTNVHKHAGQVRTEVVLRYGPATLELEISNDRPVRRPEQLPGSGMGLVSLRERAEVMGGRLTAGPRAGGGFSVVVELPYGGKTE